MDKMYNRVLTTEEDSSVNFITDVEDGAIEARFVQRVEDTVIVYLSSMTGCNLACRFCHLTQTGQTQMRPVTVDEYIEQATDVLSYAKNQDLLSDVKYVHFNFMARGDALSNSNFLDNGVDVLLELAGTARLFGLTPKFKISTIFPKTVFDKFSTTELKQWVFDILSLPYEIEFYYSLYSSSERFRRRWLPKALHPTYVGSIFKDTTGVLRLHHALIDGENTHEPHIRGIQIWLSVFNITCRVNIVRYNSFNKSTGRELSEYLIHEYMRKMKESPHVVDVHLISKVSTETKASCGMFVEKETVNV